MKKIGLFLAMFFASVFVAAAAGLTKDQIEFLDAIVADINSKPESDGIKMEARRQGKDIVWDLVFKGNINFGELNSVEKEYVIDGISQSFINPFVNGGEDASAVLSYFCEIGTHVFIRMIDSQGNKIENEIDMSKLKR